MSEEPSATNINNDTCITGTTSYERFEMLLKKTENFSCRFDTADVAILKDPSAPPVRRRGRQKKQKESAELADHRHRKSEREEDEEILAAAEADKDNLVMFDKTPYYIEGEMRDYQIRGLNWLIQLQHNGINGILADEMGLGKTLQTISLLGFMKNFKHIDGPFLIINPKSTLQNWMNELNRWCPSLRAICLIGSEDERSIVIREKLQTNEFDVLVTSYEIVLRERAALRKFHWNFIVIDEAHRIKNEKSKLSEVVREFKSTNRLLITGTPLQNNLHELWSLLNFLLPTMFSSAADFDSWFEASQLKDQDVVARLHRVLQPFLLRRIKSDVEKSLLPKKEVKIYVGMSQMQREWYQKILMKELSVINGAGKPEKARLMNILMHLRKCVNHPYLFDGAEPGPPYTTDQHIIDNSGKMVLLDKLLRKLKEQGSRVLIFSQFSRMLDLLEDYCWFREYDYCRLDGQTPHEERQQQIDEYNAEGSEKFIFMLTTRAGGLGINLTSADVVIVYDSDWNPQMDLQAMDRAHRIGQKKQVRVFRFIAEETVDDRIIERAEMKLRLDSIVIQQGRIAEAQKTLGKDDMLDMIRHGAHMVFASKDSTISDEDIDIILEKAEEKTKQMEERLQSMGESALQNFAFDHDVGDLDKKDGFSCYTWNGIDYRTKQAEAAIIPRLFIAPRKRERKVNYHIDYRNLNAAGPGSRGGTNKAIRPKQPLIYDFQFYPLRLNELFEKETYYYQNQIRYRVPLDGKGKEAEAERLEMQRKIDEAVPLTQEEKDEMAELLTQGFANWGRRDFTEFVKAIERYGRNDLPRVAHCLRDRKTLEEIEAYAKVFWERNVELKKYEQIIAQIEKGEQNLQKFDRSCKAVETKLRGHQAPFFHMRISYGSNKGKNYRVEHDRFLLCELQRIGPSNPRVYERICQSIRESNIFRFDFFFRTRTSIEIRRRCRTLLMLVDREINGTKPNKRQRRVKTGEPEIEEHPPEKLAEEVKAPEPSKKKQAKAKPKVAKKVIKPKATKAKKSKKAKKK